MEGFRHFWRSKLNPVLLMITEGNPRFGVEIWAFRGRMRWWFLGFRKVQAKLCSHTPFSLGVEIWRFGNEGFCFLVVINWCLLIGSELYIEYGVVILHEVGFISFWHFAWKMRVLAQLEGPS